jgi:hypothetical protein
MGKEKVRKESIMQSVVQFVREHHKDEIEKAYTYFWDEDDPTEFLRGTALQLGFTNFEDWLVIDYKATKEKETFLDIFKKSTDTLTDNDLSIIERIKESVLSLYEVISVSKDKKVRVKDLLLGEEHDLQIKILSKGLKKGDIFAARLLLIDERQIMSGSVYPFSAGLKKKVLESLDKQFNRYRKNVNADGTMKAFLKDYGDLFNIIWIKYIVESSHGRA